MAPTDVTVHLSAADGGGSGVAATQYRPRARSDWLTAAGDALRRRRRQSARARTPSTSAPLDAAGNASVTGSCTVRVDATPPSPPPPASAPTALRWTTTRDAACPAAPTTAPAAASPHPSVDGATQTYTKAFVVSGVGQHPVTYWSVDKIGNVEAARTGWVNISDLYAQAEGLAATLDSHWRNGTTTVKITGRGIPARSPSATSSTVDRWLEVSSPATFDVSGAGHHTVNFYAKNGKGVESVHQTGYVNIDVVAPVTTTQVSAPRGWVNHGVTLVFLASDDASGIAGTFSALDGGAEVEGTSREVAAPADHTGDGVHTVTYWSTDAAGNAGAASSAVIRIDTRKPTTRAPYSAAVTRGKTVKLRFVVADQAPCAGTASAKIVVKNARGRTVKTVKAARVTAGATSTVKFRCKLAKGKYRFFVSARDAAGNPQSKIASNRLTVR